MKLLQWLLAAVQVLLLLSGIGLDFAVLRVDAASRRLLLPKGVRVVQLGERRNFEPVLLASLSIRGSYPTEVPTEPRKTRGTHGTNRPQSRRLAAAKKPKPNPKPKPKPTPKPKPKPKPKPGGKKTPAGAPPPPQNMRRFALPPPS